MDEQENINRDYGKDVDSLIRIKEQARVDLAKSTMKLLEMGVKTFKDGAFSYLPGLDVDKFARCLNQEFYWEAEYEDGSVLKQFEGRRQHHYGHIDQTKLKYFRWVSNFYWQTDSEEKRVIVSLNFKDGTFEFTNGMVPQEVRGEVWKGTGFIDDILKKKLILKMVKRTSTSQEFPSGNPGETLFYQRFLIGWECEGVKVILCIEPNGFVHLWHGE